MKENTSNTIKWELISNYLSGEMSAEEKLNFEEFMISNPEYAKIIAGSNKDLELIKGVKEIQEQFKADAAWANLKPKLSEFKLEPNSNVKSLFMGKWIRVAAMLVISVGLAWASYSVYTEKFVPYIYIASEINESGKTIELADGSTVTLNGKSSLSYPRSFDSKERRVKLSGEAFFSIAKNPKKAFVISVENAEIKVLGTSFNVNSSTNHVEVLVETGKVKFSLAKEPSDAILLEKGDFGILNKNLFTKTAQNDENYLSWKTQLMVFKAMSLYDVAKVINRTYQVNIQFSDTAIQKLPISTSFNQTPLDVVLENLCRPHNLNYEKIGSRIIIKREFQ